MIRTPEETVSPVNSTLARAAPLAVFAFVLGALEHSTRNVVEAQARGAPLHDPALLEN